MNVQQIQAATITLAAQITAAVQAFETQTGCIVHSLPIEAATKTVPAIVRVKVQIP